MEEVKIESRNTNETINLGKKLASLIIKSGLETVILTLEGDLGAGKTTLTKGILETLESSDNVESPTFVFLHIHNGKIKLYHFDFYRISTLNEIDEIGILEFLQKKGIIVIEWGEKVREIIEPDIAIIIKKTGKNKRELTFEYSEKFKRVFYENFINK